jgi:hypothetical protein
MHLVQLIPNAACAQRQVPVVCKVNHAMIYAAAAAARSQTKLGGREAINHSDVQAFRQTWLSRFSFHADPARVAWASS